MKTLTFGRMHDRRPVCDETLQRNWTIGIIGILICLFLLASLAAPVFAAVDDANTLRLLHFDGGISDESGNIWAYHNQVSPVPPPSISSIIYKFGSGSLNNSIDNATMPYTGINSTTNIGDFNHSTSDFTYDFWYMCGGNPQTGDFYSRYASGTDNEIIGLNVLRTEIYYQYTTGGTARANYKFTTSALTEHTWYHIAIVRYGGDISCYLNGFSMPRTITTAVNGNLGFLGGKACIGGLELSSGIQSTVAGCYDEWRYSNKARWTSNFIPPYQAYGPPPALTCDNDFFLVDASTNSVIDDSGSVTATDTVLGTVVSDSTNTNGLYTLALNESQSYTVVGAVPGYLNGTISISPPLNGAWEPNYPYNIFMTRANSNASRAYVNFFVTSPKYYGASPTPQQGARITINGASGVTNFAGYYQYDANKNTSYIYTVTTSGFMSRTGSFNISVDTTINIVLDKIYETPTPTPFPTGTVTPPGAIPTLSVAAKTANVQRGMDTWYNNIPFIADLLFLAFIMGVIGLIGGGRRGGGGGYRRRRGR